MTSQVVLGLGGCVDYETTVSGSTLERLAAAHRITAGELVQPSVIESERDLVISILTYLRSGTGGELHVASLNVLNSFAENLVKRVALGGTSVRAALAMSRLAVPSTLHLVCFNKYFAQLLPADVNYVSSGYPDAIFPHLIVQYDAGTTVRVGDIDLTAPAPNRVIYVNDPANEELAISDELGALLDQGTLFLLSGFNSVSDETVLEQRLRTLRSDLERLPPESLVYYEDAAFHRPEFSHRVHQALSDHIDIYGLNQDEMQAYLSRTVDLLAPGDVLDAVIALHAIIPVRTLVLHTAFWSAAVGPDPGRFAKALDEGMIVAAARYLHGDGFTDDDLAEIRRMPRGTPATAFASELEHASAGIICCRPGFELQVTEPTTVGLGDTFVGGFLATLEHAPSS